MTRKTYRSEEAKKLAERAKKPKPERPSKKHAGNPKAHSDGKNQKRF